MQDSQAEVGQPSPQETPQSVNERVELVRSLFAEGVSPFTSTGRIGLHGTSIENLVSMVKSGNITPDLDKTRSQGETHDDRFYLTPYKDALQGTPLFGEIKDISPNTVFQAAADYSTIAAFYSYMKEKIPGLLNDDWYTHFVLSPKTLKEGMMLSSTPEGKFTYEHMLSRGKELGIDQSFLEQTIQEARQRRGVVLAINLDAAQKYPIMNGDRVPGQEIYLQGRRLPFKELIKGAEPMLSSSKEEIFSLLQ